MANRRCFRKTTPKKAQCGTPDDGQSLEQPELPVRTSSETFTSEVSYANRLPKPNRTGNWAIDAQRDTEYEAFKELITILWQNPDRILATTAYARKLGEVVDNTGDMWEGDPPNTFAGIDRDWICKWMATWSSPVPSNVLDAMTCTDNAFVHKLFSLALKIPLTTPVPKQLQRSKTLTQRFCDRRLKQTGRMKAIVAAIVGEKYDIKVGAAYNFEWGDSDVIKITHIDGDIVKPQEHARFSKAFKFTGWYSDLNAAVSLPPTKHVLKNYFEPGTGPWKHVMKKEELDAIVEGLQRTKNSEEQIDVTPVLPKAKMKHQAELSARAKATLAKHRESVKRKAEISLE